MPNVACVTCSLAHGAVGHVPEEYIVVQLCQLTRYLYRGGEINGARGRETCDKLISQGLCKFRREVVYEKPILHGGEGTGPLVAKLR